MNCVADCAHKHLMRADTCVSSDVTIPPLSGDHEQQPPSAAAQLGGPDRPHAPSLRAAGGTPAGGGVQRRHTGGGGEALPCPQGHPGSPLPLLQVPWQRSSPKLTVFSRI